MSPVDQLKFERELANKREYTPEQAKKNIADTLLGLAYSTPGLANSMSIRDAFEAKEAAAETDDPEEKKRLNAQAVTSVLSAFLPFRIGSPSAGSASRLGVFAGPAAKTADHAALARAKGMAKAGAGRDEIIDATNWFKDVDGKWKFEIDDSRMAAMIRPAGDPDFRDITRIVKHPELFEAYPQLRDIDFIKDNYGTAGRGSFAGSFDSNMPPSIRVAPGEAKQNRSVMLHELQHAIQNVEGFGRGGSVSEYASGPMFSKRAKDLQGDLSKEITGGLSARPDEIIKTVKYADPDALDGIIKKHGFDSVDDALDFLAKEDELRTPFGQYRRQSGEVEARNVEARKDMHMDERRAKRPWETQDVPDNEQIVRFYGEGPQDVFVPVADQGRADMAREMYRNLPKNYSRPDRANKAVFQQTRTFFGPGGEAKEVLPDAEMQIIRKLHGGETRPLGEIIDHPQLFDRFPETAEIPVEILPKVRNSTGEGYNRPIARSEGSGFQISENGKPRWIKDNIAKLLQYNIAEKHGFPAAASHGLDESVAKMDRVIAAVRNGLKSEAVPAGAAVSYLDKLEKTRGRLLLAQEAAKSDVSRSPWLREKFPGMEGPLEAREARRAISKALNDRTAGNIDAKLSQHREVAASGQYPYTGQSLGEMIVLPQQTEDIGQLAEFLKNWRAYGQGAPHGGR